MSTLFFFGENLSFYLSWLRTNAGPCLTPRRVGSRGRWWRGSTCFRFAKPLRVVAATPAPANMPLACLLDGAAQGFDPLTIRQNQRKTRQGKPVWSFLVPVAGVEPARCHHQWILSPPRLPIPTHRRLQRSLYNRI